MFKIIQSFLLDDVGTWAMIAAAGIGVGGTVLGASMSPDQRMKTEAFPGQTQGIQDLMNTAQANMNKAPTTSGVNFNLKPSDIGNATKGAVLGKIDNPTDYSGYSKTLSDNLYSTRKAQIDEQYAVEQKRQNDMYNRLGLVSSTPGLQAAQDLGRKQTTDINAVGAQQAQDAYDKQMQAKEFGDTLGLNYTTLGNTMGQQDIANQKYTQGQNYTDITNANEQPLKWAQVLGGAVNGAQQPYYPEQTPSSGQQIGMAGQDLGSLMLLYSMLGKTSGTPTNGGTGISGANWQGGAA